MVRSKILFFAFVLSSQILEVTRAGKNNDKVKQEDEYDSIFDNWTGWEWEMSSSSSSWELWAVPDHTGSWSSSWDAELGAWDVTNFWDTDTTDLVNSGSFWSSMDSWMNWWTGWDTELEQFGDISSSSSVDTYWDWDPWDWDSYDWNSWTSSWSTTWSLSSSAMPVDADQWNQGNGIKGMDLINVDQYWSEDPDLNWCKDAWYPDRVTDSVWADLVEEFVNSGNLTNWCVFPGQVMVVSDLRNVNLNDPNALPTIFDYVIPLCTKRLCQRHLENRKKLDPNKLVERVWRVLEIYRSIGCMKCFCKSGEKDELAELMSITNDHLRNNEFLSYSTTEESPEEVVKYFEELKEILGLDTIKLPHDKMFIALKSMEEAVEGPGRAALDIQRYSKLAQGIYNFCG